MATIVFTVIVTVFVFTIVLNFTPGEKQITEEIQHLYGVQEPQFHTAMSYLLGPPLERGNVIVPLVNGNEIFPAMLRAISEAQHSICFETYIYASGSLGRRFAEALAERARSGVSVHVIVDFIGSFKMNREIQRFLKSAGVELVKYHPLRWYTLSQLNNRTHRKLLIVDGRIGFIGGVGISDEWLGTEDEAPWRDTHARVEGPVVAHLQAAFMDNWLKTRTKVLHGSKYFPSLVPLTESDSGIAAQVFRSSSDEGGESARLMLLMSIACAKKSIAISASYFVPDALAIHTLCEARARGVEIEVIMPGPASVPQYIRILSRSIVEPLLRCGVRIYEYQLGMYHPKIIVVDGVWTSIGSMNFDNRSFRLNDEANLNCLNATLADEFLRQFAEDRIDTKEFTLVDWNARSRAEKFCGMFLRLFRTQL